MDDFGSEFIAQIATHITTQYANWGSTHAHIVGAMAANPNINFRVASTEYTGAGAALGSAIYSGQPGFMTVTQSVGNLSGGLAAVNMAYKMRVPLLLLQTNKDREGEGAHWSFQQGADFAGGVRGMARFLHASRSDTPRTLAERAMREMYTGAGRPVVVDLYSEEHKLPAPSDPKKLADLNFKPRPLSDSDKGKLDAIASANSVLFILGRGYAYRAQINPGLRVQFSNLVKGIGAGVATDSDALGEFPITDNNYVGLATRLRNPAALHSIGQFKDMRILLGAIPDEILTDHGHDQHYAENAFLFVHPDKRIIQIMQKRFPKMVAIHADVDEVIEHLGKQAYQGAAPRNILIERLHKGYMEETRDFPIYDEINVNRLARQIAKGCLPNTIHVFDGGISANAMAYALRGNMAPGSMVSPQRWVGTAHNIAAGMADAQKGKPHPIIAHIGDGAAHYSLAQLAQTNALAPNIPLIVIIYNNSGQIAAGHRFQMTEMLDAQTAIRATEFPATNFAQIARGLGLNGIKWNQRSTSNHNIADAITAASNRGGVTVIDVTMTTSQKVTARASDLYK